MMVAEPQVLTTLRRKRDQIVATINRLEAETKAARSDLAHVNATLHLFEVSGEPTQFPVYVDLHRLFRRYEIWELCSKALQAATGPLTTRELAAHVIAAKGWDRDDGALRKAVAYRIVQALTMQMKRGKVTLGGKRAGVNVWSSERKRAAVTGRPSEADGD